MSITAGNGKIIVEFKPDSIHGASALAGYMIRFVCSYNVPCWKDNTIIFQNVSAKVFVASENIYLGIASPEMPVAIRPRDHAQSRSLTFELLLTGQQIENIEKSKRKAFSGFLKYKKRSLEAKFDSYVEEQKPVQKNFQVR